MSMSTHVVGFRKADEQWKKMKTVFDACVAADATVPDEVCKFFDYEYPGDKPGMEIDLKEACTEWGDEFRAGYEIDITKLPEGVRYIRMYNSH